MVNRFSEQNLAYVMLVQKRGLKSPFFSFWCQTNTVFYCFFRDWLLHSHKPDRNIEQMELNDKEVKDTIAFYQEEKLILHAKLKHIETMLRKLQGNNLDSESGVLLTRKGTKAKKRGPKSVWGKFILEQLEGHQRPMTYKELMDSAMKIYGYDQSKFSNVRASILNSAFRLRAIAGKVTTIGELGKKEKFIVSTKWLDDKGKLPQAQIKWLKQTMDFTPEPVDMSAIPQAKYEEDLAS